MAGGQERILRERIRSIQATKKITRAMELIAASRIVKAQARVTAAVPYSDQITEVVKDLAASGASSDSPLLAGRGEIKKTCYVAITADRGLCGGYNSGIQRSTEGEVKADVPNELGDLIAQFKDHFNTGVVGPRGVDPLSTDAGEVGDAESDKTLATE